MQDIHPQTVVVTTNKIKLGLIKHIISVTINYKNWNRRIACSMV